MITISDSLYARYREDDFYTFLFAFLRDNARGSLRAALGERERCRAVWAPFFEPERPRMELALRHAYALGCEIAGEGLGGTIPDDVTPMQMKARLDGWDFVPFSAFDLELT
ncbi:hypothetical protein [Erythrobacter sp. JK5]|uniref:hypothetical protein n=1 Tax=Erythrobacter sp. JK5 TaxID=2829500 RepID=UPI001BA990B4|nr:hypothetical protein [Erythrobacter sp. JK5]QUL38368.1 hypothetical protein KDC96_02835 [Erythrobacter sp. JK5]